MLGNLFRTSSQKTTLKTDKQSVNDNAPVKSQVVGSSVDPITRNNRSLLNQLDVSSTQVFHQAEKETNRLKLQYIEPEQILIGLLYDKAIFDLFHKQQRDPSEILKVVQQQEKSDSFSEQPTLSAASLELIKEASQIAGKNNSQFITPLYLFEALYSFQENSEIKKLLIEQGITPDMVQSFDSETQAKEKSSRSFLSTYGIDLTEQARQNLLDPVTGRDKEVEHISHILLRRTKNNPIIIGDAGVGKTAVVEGLAEKIIHGNAPKDLLNKKIVQLDLSSLVAGASHRGEFEERLRNVIKEVQISSGNIILFIDEIHTLIGTGEQEGGLDASNIVKPFLSRGQIQVIGTTTIAEYRKYFQKDRAFERRFQPVLLEEPTEEIAVQMLEILKPKYEKFHKVEISQETIKAAVHLSKRYIGERFLPDKAVDLIDEAAAKVKLEHSEGKRASTQVTVNDINMVVSDWTGIPVSKLTESESQKLLKLESIIHKRLINQEHAVSSVSEAVRRGRIGLTNANRPISSFIFLGPTGVGKTELAKSLAENLFGKEEAMIRLDMSEYMEKHEVAKLIGAPPGYVGYEEGGQLTEAVRRKPYSIILLDEVEKAHPDVFNILLQILEDGRLTDNKGSTISFKNTILIATSNIGSVLIQQQLSGNKKPTEKKQNFEKLSEIVMAELYKFFRPELLNRFDEVIIFEPLSQDNMKDIAKLSINKTGTLLHEQGIGLAITEKAVLQLSKEGYDPVYGARPLRRLIQTSIENPIALYLIEKKFISGDVVNIDYDESTQKFTFQKAVPSAPNHTPIPEAVVQPSISQPAIADAQNGNGLQNLVPPKTQAQSPDSTQLQPQT